MSILLCECERINFLKSNKKKFHILVGQLFVRKHFLWNEERQKVASEPLGTNDRKFEANELFLTTKMTPKKQ
jgi:hypothetical protein